MSSSACQRRPHAARPKMIIAAALFVAAFTATICEYWTVWMRPASAALFALGALAVVRCRTLEYESLAQVRQLNRKLVDACRGGVFVVDRNRRLIEWNPMVARFTGVRPAQALDRPLERVMPDWAAGEIAECLTIAFEGVEASRRGCFQECPRTGAVDRIDVYCTPVEAGDGTGLDVLCLLDFGSIAPGSERPMIADAFERQSA